LGEREPYNLYREAERGEGGKGQGVTRRGGVYGATKKPVGKKIYIIRKARKNRQNMRPIWGRTT